MNEARRLQEAARGGSAETEMEEAAEGGGEGVDVGKLLKRGDERGEGGNGKEKADEQEEEEEEAKVDIFAAEVPALAGLLKHAAGGGGGGGGGLRNLEGGLEVEQQSDAEGYFQHRPGDRIKGRYKVLGAKGKGVFSSVLLAEDEQSQNPQEKQQVAIKILRGNELMLQAGVKEAALLRDLGAADPKGQAHVIRLLDDFRLGGHVCLVMEAMHMNLRTLLKTYGGNQGIAIKAVLSYTKQLLAGLAFLEKQRIVHADLKPDNLVVNQQMTVLKICDFGSAMPASEMAILGDAPYLQSRFYRAPENVLGYDPRGPPMDMWSAACAMVEMYTGKVLFPGRHNNELLKNVMDLRGPFPRRLLKKASLRAAHFDDDLAFLCRELAPGKQQQQATETVRAISHIQPTRNLGDLLLPPRLAAKAPADLKASVELLRQVVDGSLALDPAKRLTPLQALALFRTTTTTTQGK